MAGMYEIVGFDEIVGSYPPHSTEGLDPQVIGDEFAGDALISGDAFISGADPADHLLAIAGLGGAMQPAYNPYAAAPTYNPYAAAQYAAAMGLDPLTVAGLTAPKVPQKAVRQAMMRNFQPRTIDVRSRAARAPRRLVLNFRALAVQSGLTVDLPARPQLPFRPERLFVQSDIAGNFEIVDIIIGNRSQFAQATPMSARIAAETSFGFDLHMDTAMVAMDVMLRIANITGAPSDFRATIVGTSAIP
jgi:hypothetical protein